METALDLWRAREAEPWIVGCRPADMTAMVRARQGEFARRPAAAPVEIVANRPIQFVAEFCAAISHWTPLSLYLGPASAGAAAVSDAAVTRVMIATGGTTGVPRYAVHTWATLTAAARALQQRLGGGPIDSVCFLPLAHVSGLMQLVRSFVTGGRLTLADWREIRCGRFPAVSAGAVTSLVPTQLARLLDLPGALPWLRSFRAVFVGGGGAWRELIDRARDAGLPLAPCYGMTETAAQVTLLMPEEFLAGQEGVGRVLPHARIEIVDESAGQVLAAGEAGRIRISAPSVFCGYHFDPSATSKLSFLTADRGVLSAHGSLTVLGRFDAIINTGGEKVDPADIEAAIRATGLVADVAVVGVPDKEWGEVVVALIVGVAREGEAEIIARVSSRLSAPQRPKRWVSVPALPRSEAGKLDRRELRALAEG